MFQVNVTMLTVNCWLSAGEKTACCIGLQKCWLIFGWNKSCECNGKREISCNNKISEHFSMSETCFDTTTESSDRDVLEFSVGIPTMNLSDKARFDDYCCNVLAQYWINLKIVFPNIPLETRLWENRLEVEKSASKWQEEEKPKTRCISCYTEFLSRTVLK